MNGWWSLNDILKLHSCFFSGLMNVLEVKLKKIIFFGLFVFFNSSVWRFTLNKEISIPLSQILLFLDYTGLRIGSGQNRTRTTWNVNLVYVSSNLYFSPNFYFILESWQRTFAWFLHLQLWVSENSEKDWCSSTSSRIVVVVAQPIADTDTLWR